MSAQKKPPARANGDEHTAPALYGNDTERQYDSFLVHRRIQAANGRASVGDAVLYVLDTGRAAGEILLSFSVRGNTFSVVSHWRRVPSDDRGLVRSDTYFLTHYRLLLCFDIWYSCAFQYCHQVGLSRQVYFEAFPVRLSIATIKNTERPSGLAIYETEDADALIIPSGDVVMALPRYCGTTGSRDALLLPWGQEA